MTTPNDLFNELTYLTELYLLQEFKLSDWIYAEPESYSFFKQLVSKQKKQPSASAPPPVAIKTEPVAIQETAAIVEKEPSKLNEPIRMIKLEPMEPPKAVNFDDIRAILQEKVPNLRLVEEPQKNITEAILLYSSPSPSHQVFLANLARAIEICLCPISLIDAPKIESTNGWERLLRQPGLKIIVMPQHDLEKLPNLSKYYIPGKTPCLDKIPLFLLPDIALIFKEPLRKQALWNSLESYFVTDAHE